MRERGVTVARLREVLGALRDDDVLNGNAVQNLLVLRGGEYVGYVELVSDAACEAVLLGDPDA